MNRVITLMPVRLAATRLPNKPLININGKTLVQRVYENVQKGESFSNSLEMFKGTFPTFLISMVAAGEIGGMLDKTLLAMSNQLHKDKQLKDAIKGATQYPKMVGGLAIIIVIFI